MASMGIALFVASACAVAAATGSCSFSQSDVPDAISMLQTKDEKMSKVSTDSTDTIFAPHRQLKQEMEGSAAHLQLKQENEMLRARNAAVEHQILQLTQSTPTCPNEYMLYSEGVSGNDEDEKISAVYPVKSNTEYKVEKVEVLRNDLGHSSEYVKYIKVNGVNLGACNPDGDDYDCTYFDCSKTHSFTSTSSQTQVEVSMMFTGHSHDCNCDTNTWLCRSEKDASFGGTAMKAVARIVLKEVGSISTGFGVGPWIMTLPGQGCHHACHQVGKTCDDAPSVWPKTESALKIALGTSGLASICTSYASTSSMSIPYFYQPTGRCVYGLLPVDESFTWGCEFGVVGRPRFCPCK